MCGKCLSMSTYAESLCCRDTNEIPDDYFEGNQLKPYDIEPEISSSELSSSRSGDDISKKDDTRIGNTS